MFHKFSSFTPSPLPPRWSKAVVMEFTAKSHERRSPQNSRFGAFLYFYSFFFFSGNYCFFFNSLHKSKLLNVRYSKNIQIFYRLFISSSIQVVSQEDSSFSIPLLLGESEKSVKVRAVMLGLP